MRPGHTIPRLYYLLTPAFILLDYAGGVSVRAAALDAMPSYKSLYYTFCILCAVVVFAWPCTSPVVALVESLIIIVITIMSVLLPVFESFRQVADLSGDWDLIEVFDMEKVTNLLMAGMIAVLAFRMNVATLAGLGDSKGRDTI
jgi:hypothetical protein